MPEGRETRKRGRKNLNARRILYNQSNLNSDQDEFGLL